MEINIGQILMIQYNLESGQRDLLDGDIGFRFYFNGAPGMDWNVAAIVFLVRRILDTNSGDWRSILVKF